MIYWTSLKLKFSGTSAGSTCCGEVGWVKQNNWKCQPGQWWHQRPSLEAQPLHPCWTQLRRPPLAGMSWALWPRLPLPQCLLEIMNPVYSPGFVGVPLCKCQRNWLFSCFPCGLCSHRSCLFHQHVPWSKSYLPNRYAACMCWVVEVLCMAGENVKWVGVEKRGYRIRIWGWVDFLVHKISLVECNKSFILTACRGLWTLRFSCSSTT